MLRAGLGASLQWRGVSIPIQRGAALVRSYNVGMHSGWFSAVHLASGSAETSNLGEGAGDAASGAGSAESPPIMAPATMCARA